MKKRIGEGAHCRSTFARLTGLLGLCLVGFLLSVPLALAQTGQGTVTGTVTDLSQAIVPKADVTLTHLDTGVITKGQSSDVGTYYFGEVPIGSYTLTVTKTGFEQFVGTFTLSVGQNAVVNPALRVGSTTTVVEVTGAAAPIETQNGTVSDLKESDQIRDLPLNGRQVGLLFDLTPGVESGAGGARVNGMKVGSLDINLDGVTMVDRFGGGMTRVQPGIETIQEFRIETVGSDARFDQPSTVIMASRSGSNQIHGAGYEYLRDNSVIGATRLRTDPVSGFQEPLLIRNEFGGYLSGPVYIPHVYDGRNKSFWLFDDEGLRSRQRSSVQQPWVPTAAMWQGDLSNAVDSSNPCTVSPSCPTGYTPLTIYDPTTTNPTTFARTPFPNNQISGTFSPTALALKSLTALPSNSNNPFVAPNFTNTYPDITSNESYTAKWDQNISDKDRLSVRYTRSTSNAAIEGGYYANPINDQSGMGTSADNFQSTNVAVNYNRTISPNWLNELLVGILRQPNHNGTLADFTNWDQKLNTPDPFGVTGWPTIYSYEVSGAYMGWDSDNNHKQHLTSETIEDNVTWTHNKHTVQFGFRGRKEQNNIEELQQAQGSMGFGSAYTSLFDAPNLSPYPDTGSGFAEMLLGTFYGDDNELNRGFFYFRQTQVGTYVNDKIKVSPRLTLNLGLRWDYWTPYSEARNRLALPYEPEQQFEVLTPGNVNMTQLGVPASALAAWAGVGLKWATANSAGYPSALFSQVHHDFGPRVGVAYQLNHNTVIRGSYGIYYVPEPLSLLLQSMRTNPPINLNYTNNPFLHPNVPGGVNGPYYDKYPYVVAPAATDYISPASVTLTSGALAPPEGNGATTWDGQHWNDSRDQTWNVTVEHELPKQIGMRLSYIGTFGGNLAQQYAIDDAEPNYNYAVRTGLLPPGDSNDLRAVKQWSLYAINHTGYSRDHSFQAEVHRTFSSGVAFQAFYTFTRQLNTIDPSGFSDGNTTVNGGGGSGLLGGSGGATVPESFEILGEPSLSYAQRERLTYFNSTTIPPHHVTFNGIYDLPFGKGKYFGRNVSTPLNYLIGGWQVASIYVWNSGLWMGLTSNLVQPGRIRIPAANRATLTVPSVSSDNYRQWFAGDFNPSNAANVSGTIISANAARLAGPNCSGQYVGQLAVNLANGTCYSAAFSGFYNPAPRDNIIGPGAWNDDLSLYKHFKVGEKVDLRFAADFFNLTNHPNDIAPNPTSGLQDLSQQSTALNTSRQIQLSLRLSF
ncbi:MAG: TonB-dependent receptor [Terriglobia bacterium]|jgi:hypothetical protein